MDPAFASHAAEIVQQHHDYASSVAMDSYQLQLYSSLLSTTLSQERVNSSTTLDSFLSSGLRAESGSSHANHVEPIESSLVHEGLMNCRVNFINQLPNSAPEQSSLSEYGTLLNLDEHRSVQNANISDEAINSPSPRPICDICEDEFESFTELGKHMRRCRHKKLYSCLTCGDEFNKEKNLRLHQAGHVSAASMLSCPECEKSFGRLASFRCHLLLHQADDVIACEHCFEEFAFYTQLKQHIRDVHERGGTQAKATVFCKQCGLVVSSRAELATHLSAHRKVKESLKRQTRTRRGRYNKSRSEHTFGWLECRWCKKSFPKQSALLRHEVIHTGVRPYKCTQCSKSFNHPGALLSHKRTHLTDKPFVCKICNFGFAQRGNLRSHVLRLHPVAQDSRYAFSCPHCPSQFRSLKTLSTHVNKRHAQNLPGSYRTMTLEDTDNQPLVVSCSKESDATKRAMDALQALSAGNEPLSANIVVAREEDRSRDVRGTTSPHTELRLDVGNTKRRVFICLTCNKEFRKPSDYVRHSRTHTDERPFSCTKCALRFKLLAHLRSHMQTHLSNEQRNLYECPVCPAKLTRPQSLAVHLRRHQRSSFAAASSSVARAKYRCLTCPQTFANRKVLDEHVCPVQKETPVYTDLDTPQQDVRNVQSECFSSYAYDPDRPHVCTLCGRGFTEQRHLGQHVDAIHRKVMNYHCTLCPKTFATNSTLKDHLARHSGARTQKCQFCPKSFTTRNNLNQHVVIHRHEMPFLCGYCGKRFKTGIRLRRHCKTHRPQSGILTRAAPEVPVSAAHSSVLFSSNDEVEHRTAFRPFVSAADESAQYSGGPNVVTPLRFAARGMNFFGADQSQSSTQDFRSPDLFPVGACGLLSPGADAFIESSLSEQLTAAMADIFNVETLSSYLPAFDEPPTHPPVQQVPVQPLVENYTAASGDHPENEYFFSPALPPVELPADSETAAPPPTLFSCSLCSDTFKKRQYLKAHLLRVHSIAPECPNSKFRCEHCHASFTMKNTLNRHVMVAHVGQKWRCTICAQSFSRKFCLVRHVKEKHAEPGSVPAPDEDSTAEQQDERLEVEAEARPAVVRPTAVKVVRQAKTLDFPIMFTVTPMAANDSQCATISTQTGESVQKGQCIYCGKAFKKPIDLKRHLRVHTGEKPFTCNVCGKQFRVKSTLKTHCRRHDPARKPVVSCPVCGQAFASNSSLRVHERIHTKEKPIKCPDCSDTFRTSQQLHAHRKRHALGNLASPDQASASIVAGQADESSALWSSSARLLVQMLPNGDVRASLVGENVAECLAPDSRIGENCIVMDLTTLRAMASQELSVVIPQVRLHNGAAPSAVAISSNVLFKSLEAAFAPTIGTPASPAFRQVVQSSALSDVTTAPAQNIPPSTYTFKCSACEKVYASARSLKDHRRRLHHSPKSCVQ